ncbi:MAG: hypothetical protein ACRC8Y_11880 [Chroococcales cyanobacterium]
MKRLKSLLRTEENDSKSLLRTEENDSKSLLRTKRTTASRYYERRERQQVVTTN